MPYRSITFTHKLLSPRLSLRKKNFCFKLSVLAS